MITIHICPIVCHHVNYYYPSIHAKFLFQHEEEIVGIKHKETQNETLFHESIPF